MFVFVGAPKQATAALHVKGVPDFESVQIRIYINSAKSLHTTVWESVILETVFKIPTGRVFIAAIINDPPLAVACTNRAFLRCVPSKQRNTLTSWGAAVDRMLGSCSVVLAL